MRYLLICLLFIFATATAQYRDYTGMLTPISLTELQDETTKTEVSSIIDGSFSRYLHPHKVRSSSLGFHSHYKQTWFLSIYFDIAVTFARPDFKCSHTPATLLQYISFTSHNPSYRIPATSLAIINKEISDNFSYQQPITCSVRSYTAKDRRHHYLYLNITGSSRQLTYIFIVDGPHTYRCVRIHEQ